MDRLEIQTDKIPVGEHSLAVRTMTLHQTQEWVKQMGALDLAPVGKALAPIFGAAGSADFQKVLAENSAKALEAIVDTVSGAGDVGRRLSGILLDNEENFRWFAESLGDTDSAPKETRGRWNIYEKSDDLREWIGMIITPAQAINAITKAVEVTNLGGVGKTLMGMMGQVNGTQPESEPSDEMLSS